MQEVLIYTSGLCGFCHAAIKLLEQKGAPFCEISVDGEPDIRAEVMQRSGQRTVPQIWIGDYHVGGYTDLVALEQQQQLDALLSN